MMVVMNVIINVLNIVQIVNKVYVMNVIIQLDGN
jgi:hypothetical protein